jgi:hypothetical protein
MQPILFDYSLHIPACHAPPLVMLEASAVQAPCFPTGFPRERRLVQTGNLIWSACRSTTALGRLGLPPTLPVNEHFPKRQQSCTHSKGDSRTAARFRLEDTTSGGGRQKKPLLPTWQVRDLRVRQTVIWNGSLPT